MPPKAAASEAGSITISSTMLTTLQAVLINVENFTPDWNKVKVDANKQNPRRDFAELVKKFGLVYGNGAFTKAGDTAAPAVVVTKAKAPAAKKAAAPKATTKKATQTNKRPTKKRKAEEELEKSEEDVKEESDEEESNDASEQDSADSQE